MFFKPSTAVFTTDRDELLEFEKMHPQLEDVIKGLLRSYEGIFDYPATIYESQLAKFLHIESSALRGQLLELSNYHIIEYAPQTDKPQITILHGRLYNDKLQLNASTYLKRKKQYQLRLACLLSYVNNRNVCRSKFIASYFNDHSVKDCGICDNCINAKSNLISKEEFEKISTQILQSVKSRSLSSEELFAGLKTFKKEKLWKVIEFLLSEKKIISDKEGIISLYKTV